MKIYNHIWESDSNGCTVSTLDTNGEPLNPNADVVLRESVKAYGKRSVDLATTPLFYRVDKKIMERDTYKKFIALIDNYVLNTKDREEVTASEEQEITDFLSVCFKSKPFEIAGKYIVNELKYNLNENEFFNEVKDMWFKIYTNHYRGRSTHYCSGFEHVFVGEGQFNPITGAANNKGEISGYHSWIKFYLDEKYGRVNYLGYKYDLGGQGPDQPIVVTLQMLWNHQNMQGELIAELFKKKGGFFVGRSPECEMALGTVAMFEARAGILSGDRIPLIFNEGHFNLVLYRNIEESGRKGNYIRSFYPEYRGSAYAVIPQDCNVNAPVNRTTVRLVDRAKINNGEISIASAMINPQGADVTGEWVELVSNAENEIDISNHELRDKMSRPMKLSGILGAGARSRFDLNRAFPGGMQLGNSGGIISLHSETSLIAAVSYSSTSEGKAISFI